MEAKYFWAPYEVQINSYDDLVKQLERVMSTSRPKSLRFAWRGLVNADWALHSSLYRRVLLTTPGTIPDEKALALRETQVLADVHRWGLHVPPLQGRLSILCQLAMLQHFGAPTRLIDITFNAWVAVFFAVEEKWENGELKHENEDGRLFAFDITNRLINENDLCRSWEDQYRAPWKEASNFMPPDLRVWTSQVFAWKPPALNARIAAQNGGFLLGGVPATATPTPTGTPFQVPKSPSSANPSWTINEVRESCCLALRPHVFRPSHGRISSDALYTFRILAAAKAEIRERLKKLFGYEHSTIYPDFSGFASFGTPTLKSW